MKNGGNLGKFHCVVKSHFALQNMVFYEIFEVIDRAISSPAQSATLSPLQQHIFPMFTRFIEGYVSVVNSRCAGFSEIRQRQHVPVAHYVTPGTSPSMQSGIDAVAGF